jgi:hypothetical protein
MMVSILYNSVLLLVSNVNTKAWRRSPTDAAAGLKPRAG